MYTSDGLGYLASGKNVGEIETKCEAKQIGKIKHDSIQTYKTTRTQAVGEAVNNYRNKSICFVKSLKNLLRSPNSDRELMLRLNFIQTGMRKNKPVYEYDCCDFYAIKSSRK